MQCNGNLQYILICFHLQLIYHSYVKCKSASPTDILTEITRYLLSNNLWRQSSKIILLHWNILFSLPFFVWLNWLHVRSNLAPGMTWWQVYMKKIISHQLLACAGITSWNKLVILWDIYFLTDILSNLIDYIKFGTDFKRLCSWSSKRKNKPLL